MKIGILTFHKAHNFGAVLQCYATQEVLKGMGHEVEVIDYQPIYLTIPYRLIDCRRCLTKNPKILVERIVDELLTLKNRIARYRAFENFIHNRLQLSAPVGGEAIPSDYDAYVIGSDQVWNPRITMGFDKVFFGGFKRKSSDVRVVSYAASMEAQALSKEDANYYKSALDNFTSISVREEQLAKLLAPITSKPIEWVLDPTLLASRAVWDGLCTSNKHGRYVFIYQVRTNSNTYRIANQIAKQRGCKVIEMPAFLHFTPQSKRQAEELTEYAPEQFVSMIRNAECVVTTSFHGTAFSVIFNKPFYTIELGDNGDTRSKSLLASLHLEYRMIPQNNDVTFSSIDFTEANEKLETLRTQSFSFLENSL